jgi:uncharacterized protein with von Willebrand factor type A (vWA) domain
MSEELSDKLRKLRETQTKAEAFADHFAKRVCEQFPNASADIEHLHSLMKLSNEATMLLFDEAIELARDMLFCVHDQDPSFGEFSSRIESLIKFRSEMKSSS